MGNIHTVGPNEALIVSGMYSLCLHSNRVIRVAERVSEVD